MFVRRREVLGTLWVLGATVVGGCLRSDLPLFEVDVVNGVDRSVTVSASVRDLASEEVVVSTSQSLPPAGDPDNRITVADDFEKGHRYEAEVSALGNRNGEVFTADERGARKLTFEVEASGIAASYG